MWIFCNTWAATPLFELWAIYFFEFRAITSRVVAYLIEYTRINIAGTDANSPAYTVEIYKPSRACEYIITPGPRRLFFEFRALIFFEFWAIKSRVVAYLIEYTRIIITVTRTNILIRAIKPVLWAIKPVLCLSNSDNERDSSILQRIWGQHSAANLGT